jgi:hypothetical protein
MNAEARTHVVPIDEGQPELRISSYRATRFEPTDLLWSQVITDGRAVGERADGKERGL